MTNNIDIFICANKDFEIHPTNKSYKIVSTEDFETTTGLEHIICKNCDLIQKEHAYSELARFQYVRKNYDLKDYVGTAHYRRYFEFFNNIPDMDEIFKVHDAILPGNFNLGWPSVYANYAGCHHKDDIVDVIKIISLYYPEYLESALDTLYSNNMYPCNIFVFKKEMFEKWCDFVVGVLEKFDEMHGLKTDEDVLNRVINQNYTKDKGGLNAENEYQARIEAFLSERISNIFINKNIKNPYFENMILTEIRNEFEKSYFYYKPDVM